MNEEMERELHIGLTRDLDPERLAAGCRERLGVSDDDAVPRPLLDEFVRAVQGDGHDIRLMRQGLGFGESIYTRREPWWSLGRRIDALEEVAGDLLGSAHPGAIPRAAAIRAALGATRLAAEVGFTSAAREARLAETRSLRHDLRNATGTVRNALELLADAAPREAPPLGHLAGMAARNAMALEHMLRDRLSDTGQLVPEVGIGVASPRAVALRAVGAVASLAANRGTAVRVSGDVHPLRVDASALQLMLHALLLSYLRGRVAPDAVQVLLEHPSGREFAVVVSAPSWNGEAEPRTASADAFELFRELARKHRAAVEGGTQLGSRVTLRLWTLPSAAEARDDLGGADERDHA